MLELSHLEVRLCLRRLPVDRFHLWLSGLMDSGTCRDLKLHYHRAMWINLCSMGSVSRPKSLSCGPILSSLRSLAQDGMSSCRRCGTLIQELSQSICSCWCQVGQIPIRKRRFSHLCPSASSSCEDRKASHLHCRSLPQDIALLSYMHFRKLLSSSQVW